MNDDVDRGVGLSQLKENLKATFRTAPKANQTYKNMNLSNKAAGTQ